MRITDDTVLTCVFLVNDLYGITDTDQIINKLGFKQTPAKRVENAAKKLGGFHRAEVKPSKEQWVKGKKPQKNRPNKKGEAPGQLVKLQTHWKGTTVHAKVDFIFEARSDDAIKEEPEVVVGKPIITPSAPYFAEAAAAHAAGASRDAAAAKTEAAAATIGRAARHFLNRMAKAMDTKVPPVVGDAKEDDKESTDPLAAGPTQASDDSSSGGKSGDKRALDISKEEPNAEKRTRKGEDTTASG